MNSYAMTDIEFDQDRAIFIYCHSMEVRDIYGHPI